MNKSTLFKKFIEYFTENMPVAESELHYKNPYQLLVAVILSAQCTDKRVNIITPPFFKVFPDLKSLSKAEVVDIFELIKSCSYPNNKAKNLSGMAKTIVKDFGGIVPDDYDKLITVPGVGRKTAHVVLSVAFDQNKLAVDTHVHRVSARIGLTSNAKTPLETERQLMKYFPEAIVGKAHHWLILHGRYVCKARKPLCEKCGITTICSYFATSNNIK
ncbi:MAG: endonuclease III [Bacteroidetes bacterium HGW-Bacteroidetes-21]|jgi:endonuclease-3|nr:MAG: endonuclease III [Bacteroidetes bacterium HGW-Bacteroidetes-21]